MDIKQSEPFEDNDSIWVAYNIQLTENTMWSVTVASGKTNRVIVRKISPNPWNTGGKWFDTFEESIQNYKSKNMKKMLKTIQNKFEEFQKTS